MASTWQIRLLTLVVWAVAAWSATFWGLKHLQSSSAPASATPVPTISVQAAAADLQRVLGRNLTASAIATPAPARQADPAARFSLLGVVASRDKSGVALLSIDGKAARPFRVGTEVETGLKLVKVDAREATLEGTTGAPSFTLALSRAGKGAGSSTVNPAAAASAAQPSG